MIYRKVSGLLLAFVYLLIFTGSVSWFANFNSAQKTVLNPAANPFFSDWNNLRAMLGIFSIYVMALLSIYFILISKKDYGFAGGILLAFLTFFVLFLFN